ncbi:DUF4097 family beta strand repeat-containing protein [Streptomyces sp. 6N223]|uniref:DUF4097 family beta strand repeat-containing protein n=1 Tax=Streptomyces sp. 6N223 TaxID=3457412 RepID=UPI003FD50F53
MPRFDTPEPISATVEFELGSVRITASARDDTVVEVLPTDGTREADVRYAQQTKVTCSDGRLLVKGPMKPAMFGPSRSSGSLDISVELPAGSGVEATSSLADVTCTGRLGEVRLKTGLGDIQVEEAANAHLKTSHGDIRLDRATGEADASGMGRVEIGEVTGVAVVRNGNGETAIGEVVGELRVRSSNGSVVIGVAHSGVDVKSANGSVSVDIAHGGVVAKTANGGIRVGEISGGKAELHGGAGNVEVGIPEATAAWLDVHTRFGAVRNSLGAAEGPDPSEKTVEVRARTGVGDIIIHRSGDKRP